MYNYCLRAFGVASVRIESERRDVRSVDERHGAECAAERDILQYVAGSLVVHFSGEANVRNILHRALDM